MQQSLYHNSTKCQENSACLTRSFSCICLKQKKSNNSWKSKYLFSCQVFLWRKEYLFKPWRLERCSNAWTSFEPPWCEKVFCFKQMRANERVRLSEKDKRNLLGMHLVQLWYNDCCLIKLLFSHYSHMFLPKNKFRSPLPKAKMRSEVKTFLVQKV
jgi:hypothetical protein